MISVEICCRLKTEILKSRITNGFSGLKTYLLSLPIARYHILTDFALEICCPFLLIIWYIHIIKPIRWAVIKLLSAVNKCQTIDTFNFWGKTWVNLSSRLSTSPYFLSPPSPRESIVEVSILWGGCCPSKANLREPPKLIWPTLLPLP